MCFSKARPAARGSGGSSSLGWADPYTCGEQTTPLPLFPADCLSARNALSERFSQIPLVRWSGLGQLNARMRPSVPILLQDSPCVTACKQQKFRQRETGQPCVSVRVLCSVQARPGWRGGWGEDEGKPPAGNLLGARLGLGWFARLFCLPSFFVQLP